jgi:ribonuclease HI
MQRVTIYTDGACLGNPGPGGWAALLQGTNGEREVTGFAPATTNNRMELLAALEGLRALGERSEVDLHTDSQYLRNGMNDWLARWKRNGWRTASKQPVKNVDLWQALDETAAQHVVRWHWVRGHDGHPENERCDALANEAIRRGLGTG